jgi:cyclopropane fatty-acyl-phospholipid synthase-like methyltransferase
VLERVLAKDAGVLEIASGTGEHAMFVARAMPGVRWQTSDPDADSRASIAAWIAHENLMNVLPPLAIDVRSDDWSAGKTFDAIVAINMLHIAPWEATLGLFRGASLLLKPGGTLFLYGPFKREGAHTALSNEAFDQWLKQRNPEFGVRDLGDVAGVGEANGLALREMVEMPANNFSVIFIKS